MKVLMGFEYNKAIRNRNINILVLTENLKMKLKKYDVKDVRISFSIEDMKLYYIVEFKEGYFINSECLDVLDMAEYKENKVDCIFFSIDLNSSDTTKSIKEKQQQIIDLIRKL